MKSFRTFCFVFAMFLATGFMISAFILLYSYSSDNEVKGNLLENTSVNRASSAEYTGKANLNQRSGDTPADSNVKQFSKKWEKAIFTPNKK